MYVVDASVLVADARPLEPHHPEARALLKRISAENRAVFLPSIALAEVASALSRGTGRPDLARRWVRALQGLPNLQFVVVDHDLAALAADLAADQGLRGCDAVYVALARQRGARLVTLDHRQRSKVPPDVLARTPAEELTAG